jgi:hypothetical protein
VAIEQLRRIKMSFSRYILYLCENGEIGQCDYDDIDEFNGDICPKCKGKIIESITCFNTNGDTEEEKTNNENYEKLKKLSDKIFKVKLNANKIKINQLDEQLAAIKLTVSKIKRDKKMIEKRIKKIKNNKLK